MAASAVPKCIFMHQSQELSCDRERSSCSLLPVSSQNRTEMEPHCWPILAQLFPYLILLHSSCFDIQDNWLLVWYQSSSFFIIHSSSVSWRSCSIASTVLREHSLNSTGKLTIRAVSSVSTSKILKLGLLCSFNSQERTLQPRFQNLQLPAHQRVEIQR